MTEEKQPRPELKKPEDIDFKAMMEFIKKVIAENKDWLKEMAKK